MHMLANYKFNVYVKIDAFSAIAYFWKIQNFFAMLIKSNRNQNLFAQSYHIYM